MRVNLLFFVFIASFSNVFAQIYSGGNDDGFSVACYAQADNPAFAIYSVGNDDGFSFSCVGSVGSEVPLPIELISFKAACNKGSVYLKWVTASEINNDYFTLERSTDAINWTIIGTVDGAGNSNQNINYSYVDNEPYNGVSYYRLKQTDFDGQFKYSNIIAIICIDDFIGDINVYPNPVSDELIIEIIGNTVPVNFEISNAQGSVIYQGNLIEKTRVNTSSFAPGVYLINFENGKTFEFKKITKE